MNIVNDISRFRQPIMGYAICLVLFVHIFFMDLLTEGSSNLWWEKLRQMGSSGVDIFLVVSAFGLYYSMKKNPSARVFYRKRIVRLLPMILIGFAIGYAAQFMADVGEGRRVPTIVIKMAFYFRHYFYSLWFLYLLFYLYLCFPVIFHYLESAPTEQARCQRSRLLMLVAILMSVMMGLSFWDLGIKDMYGTLMSACFRLPIFLTGIYIIYRLPVTTYIYRSHWVFLVSLAVSYLSSRLYPAIQYFAFGFMTLSVIKYLVWVFSHVKWLCAVFSFLGRYTLEIYVMHMYVYSHITNYLPSRSITTLAVAVALSILFAIVLHYIIQFGGRYIPLLYNRIARAREKKS